MYVSFMKVKDDNGDLYAEISTIIHINRDQMQGFFSYGDGDENKAPDSDCGGNRDYDPRPSKISTSRISLCIPFCRQMKVEFKLKHKDYEDIWCFVNDV